MKINQSFPDWFEDFLLSAGLSKSVIKKAKLNTRLYHDLNIYGDEANSLVEELEKRIHASSFRSELYFPPEFPGECFALQILHWVIPFSHQIFKTKEKYIPLTFADLMSILRETENGN